MSSDGLGSLPRPQGPHHCCGEDARARRRFYRRVSQAGRACPGSELPDAAEKFRFAASCTQLDPRWGRGDGAVEVGTGHRAGDRQDATLSLSRVITAPRSVSRGARSRGPGWLPAPCPARPGQGFEIRSPSEVASHGTLCSPTAETHIVPCTPGAAAGPSQEGVSPTPTSLRHEAPAARSGGHGRGRPGRGWRGPPAAEKGARPHPKQDGVRPGPGRAPMGGRRSQQRRGTASSGA